MDIDLLDRRGRLVRLVAAATIGLGITLVIMHLISGVARRPNADAISQVSPFLLGAAMFALISSGVFAGLTALKKRVR
jgi:hypothetical protein